MRKSKIKPAKVISGSDRIVPSTVNKNEPVSFNFRRLKTEGDKFVYKDKDASYFNKLIERIRDVCSMTRLDMTIRNARSLRCHKIPFEDEKVTEEGFGNVGDDVCDDAWQFQLSSNEHGRVHGYFVGNIFYIVWLDPNHELWETG